MSSWVYPYGVTIPKLKLKLKPTLVARNG